MDSTFVFINLMCNCVPVTARCFSHFVGFVEGPMPAAFFLLQVSSSLEKQLFILSKASVQGKRADLHA